MAEHTAEKDVPPRQPCVIHHLPRTADSWMSPCTCPSTAHGIEEAD